MLWAVSYTHLDVYKRQAAGGVLGYYDARLEAAVNNKNGSTLTDVKVDDNLTFNKNVINILLVGSDHGAIKGDHGRSDSIMIATVNFKTKELKLTSLMRDMYVEIPGHGHNKLNAAYAFGGVELLYQTIAKNFGIKIDNYCVVDFSTFEKVINKVGGVETVSYTHLNYCRMTAIRNSSIDEEDHCVIH